MKATKGITLNGQAGTYTGPGITVTGNGSTNDLVLDCDIVNCEQWNVDFGIGAGQGAQIGAVLFSTSNKTASDAAMTAGSAVLTSASSTFTGRDVGKCALVQGALSSVQTTWYHISRVVSVDSATQVTLADVASVTVSGDGDAPPIPPASVPSMGHPSTATDIITSARSSGYLFADFGGAQNLQLSNCSIRGVIYSSASCAKISVTGCRVAPSGGTTKIRGISHVFTDNTVSGDLPATRPAQPAGQH